MHLLYVDESGKSGLRDPAQPFHVLAGLAVSETQWRAIEAAMNSRVDQLVPPPRPHEWEIHMVDMVHGTRRFKGVPWATRVALRDAVFDVIDANRPTLIVVAIDKQRHLARYKYPDPPERIAYEMMIERFDSFLGRQGPDIGIIVSDEQKGVEDPIRVAHSRYRRGGTSVQAINHVIETPFFVPSHWSRMLQIVDVVAYWLNRMLKANQAGQPKPPEAYRLEQHLDGYPDYMGKGLKIFP
jgi:Protein of unknown function (DUF3800)